MKQLWAKLPAAIVVCILAALLIYGFSPKPISVDAVRVTRGPLRVTVDDDGETRIKEKYVISAPIAGQLIRMQLHAGDAVVQDETAIAQLFPAEPGLLDARTQAELEARERAADAALQQANESLVSARELMELAQHRLQRAAQLIARQATTQEEMDESEHQAAVAKASVRGAEFAVKVRSYEHQQAQAALKRVLEPTANGQPNVVPIVSPTSGKVLRVFQEDAAVVAVGTPLVEIGDVQDLEMVFDIISYEAARILPGAAVDIDHWGGDQVLKGVVRRIEPSAFLKVSALGVEEKRVNVIVDFVDPYSSRANLGDGFRVEGKITVQETDARSLKVPTGALFRHGERWHVYLVKNGRAVLTDVTMGASNGTESQILSGLQEADSVILHPTDQIQSGVRVTPTLIR